MSTSTDATSSMQVTSEPTDDENQTMTEIGAPFILWVRVDIYDNMVANLSIYKVVFRNVEQDNCKFYKEKQKRNASWNKFSLNNKPEIYKLRHFSFITNS